MFELRDTVVKDFRHYVESFLNIKDVELQEFLRSELDRGAPWPEPLLQLNPLFESGGLVDDLIEARMLDPRCGKLFRRDKTLRNPSGNPLRLFKHQMQAIELAQQGSNYVLTTGTGSGKSLSYILPIVDAVLKEGSGKGIRAIIVYPMNALANSQLGELEKYLGIGPHAGSISYARYTGQEKQEERERVQSSPPDILLTNYVMLELILTRPRERQLVRSMSNLRFVVLDELHTYRGRQGADIAMLMRRLRDVAGTQHLQTIGKSATMSTEGTAQSRRQAVADVATRIFGAPVAPEHVVGETLLPYSRSEAVDTAEFRSRLRGSLQQDVPTNHEALKSHTLTIWMERVAGLKEDDEHKLERQKPMPLSGETGIAGLLAQQAGVSLEIASAAVQRHLLAAAALPSHPITGARPFVFRLHQFLSPGLGVHGTLLHSPERCLRDSVELRLCTARNSAI